VQHVYARGNRRQAIFRDDRDREAYLRLLGRTAADREWRFLAYCLMDNHVHLLLETPSSNLGAGMQQLHGRYAREFNDRHRFSGHLFQGRYGAVRVIDDTQLWTTVRYLAQNPVDAGLCDAAHHWPWSSHGAIVAGAAPVWLDVAWLLSYLTQAGGMPMRRYLDLAAGDEPATMRVDFRSLLLGELDVPASVRELTQQLGASRQRVDHHLRALERAGTVVLVSEGPRRYATAARTAATTSSICSGVV
jgi:REP element-mobilizing transposase RayT/biotin operon repressor